MSTTERLTKLEGTTSALCQILVELIRANGASDALIHPGELSPIELSIASVLTLDVDESSPCLKDDLIYAIGTTRYYPASREAYDAAIKCMVYRSLISTPPGKAHQYQLTDAGRDTLIIEAYDDEDEAIEEAA